MLNVSTLKSHIKTALSNTLPKAVEECILEMFPVKSEAGNNIAKKCAETFDSVVSEQLATSIASAIDYYVKNAEITGMIITHGSPSTHVTTITGAPMPMLGGAIPNTFGIH